MNTGIISLLIVIACSLLGILVFLFVKHFGIPRRIGPLHEQVKQGKTNQAIKGARQILAKDPRNSEAHYLLGQAYSMDGKVELAAAEYKTVGQLGDFTGICEEVPYRKEAADAFVKLNQLEEGLKEYLLLAELEPRQADHYHKAGHLFERRKMGSQAANFYRKAAKLNPRSSEIWYSLGHLLYRARRPGEAKEALQKAVALGPDNFKAFFYLGELLKAGKNYQGALDAFETAQRDPNHKTRAVIERGICFFAVRKYDDAIKELGRAIKFTDLNSDSKEMMNGRYVLSICYEQIRSIDKAVEHWEILANMKKNFRNVAEKLRQYEELRTDDRIKGFLTEAPQKFEETCTRLAAALDLAVTDMTTIPDGVQIAAEEAGTGHWRYTRRFPKLLRILRVIEPVKLASVRDFYEHIKQSGADRGYYLCSSEFTRSATEFVESRPIELMGRDHLHNLLAKAEEK